MLPDKAKGFMVFTREEGADDAPQDRIKNYNEFHHSLPEDKLREQAYRCMNCGIPFCHSGCPLGNQIPDFNDMVKDQDWEEALAVLLSTNNFPEFTGRICPAPCESACVLGITSPPVTIEMIEKEIAEHGWESGWMLPKAPARETGKKVAIVGSGPSGLAAAQQLRRAGHTVVVYEREDEPGGLLMYGIPNFKLDKKVVFRRLEQMKAEGVEFRCNSWIGKNVPTAELEQYDAVLLTVGSTKARPMPIPGADLKGIHFAMEFLPQQTKRVLGKKVPQEDILATDKRVVVLGGGDTGSDCVGTSIRQGCKSLVNFELLPKPPVTRAEDNPWPLWDFILRTSSSHKEGSDRDWNVLTKEFVGDDQGNVRALKAVKVAWGEPDELGRRKMEEVPGTEFEVECELVLLALGFTQPECDTFVEELGLELDKNRFGIGIKADDKTYMSSKSGVFAAGDARRGQSLVVWAIREGREAARQVDLYLMGESDLPTLDAYNFGPAHKEPARA